MPDDTLAGKEHNIFPYETLCFEKYGRRQGVVLEGITQPPILLKANPRNILNRKNIQSK